MPRVLPADGRSANGPLRLRARRRRCRGRWRAAGRSRAPRPAAAAATTSSSRSSTSRWSTTCRAFSRAPARICAPTACSSRRRIGGDSLTELREAFLTADAEISRRRLRAGGAVHSAQRRRRPAAARRAGAAGDRRRNPHGALRQTPLALMRELKALGASNPLADRPGTAGDADAARGGRQRPMSELAGRPRWAGARDARNHLDERLGAAREPAEAAASPGSAEVSLTEVLGKAELAARRVMAPPAWSRRSRTCRAETAAEQR